MSVNRVEVRQKCPHSRFKNKQRMCVKKYKKKCPECFTFPAHRKRMNIYQKSIVKCRVRAIAIIIVIARKIIKRVAKLIIRRGRSEMESYESRIINSQ